MPSLVLVTTAVCILCERISGISPHTVTANEDNSTKMMYVQEGKFTNMNCKISNRGLHSVSWIRKNDSMIIGVDDEIFINDSRFASRWNVEFNTYSLQIKNTKKKDSGLYECQISGWPKQSYYLDVVGSVIVNSSEINRNSEGNVHISSCLTLLPLNFRVRMIDCEVYRKLTKIQVYIGNLIGERELQNNRGIRVSCNANLRYCSAHDPSENAQYFIGCEILNQLNRFNNMYLSITPDQKYTKQIKFCFCPCYSKFFSRIFKYVLEFDDENAFPSTQILTASELIVWCGSDVNITCGVSNFLEKPEEIIWFFSDTIIRSNEHINISQKFYSVGNILISTIAILNVNQQDSGNYTCYPLGMQSSTASINVIDGEYPAAMRRSGCTALLNNLFIIRLILTLSTMFQIV